MAPISRKPIWKVRSSTLFQLLKEAMHNATSSSTTAFDAAAPLPPTVSHLRVPITQNTSRAKVGTSIPIVATFPTSSHTVVSVEAPPVEKQPIIITDASSTDPSQEATYKSALSTPSAEVQHGKCSLGSKESSSSDSAKEESPTLCHSVGKSKAKRPISESEPKTTDVPP